MVTWTMAEGLGAGIAVFGVKDSDYQGQFSRPCMVSFNELHTSCLIATPSWSLVRVATFGSIFVSFSRPALENVKK